MKKTDGLSALMNDFRFDGLPVKACSVPPLGVTVTCGLRRAG